MSVRIGSLCSGYGGLDHAVMAVFGGTLAWVSDIDPGACKVLAHRYPGVPNLGDMTAVDWSAVEPVDVLCGGTPCQDLSHAGNRAGMSEGTRSNLWVAMREAVAQLRPSVVVWENVRGAYSASADSAVESCPGCVGDEPGVSLRALGRVLGDLAELGMDARWHGLRAADVGAPHGRHRVFLVAYPATDAGCLRGVERRLAASGEAEGGRPFAVPRVGGGVDPDLALLPTPAVNDMGEGKTVERWDEWTADMQARHGNSNGHGKSLAIEAQRLLPTPKATNNENRQSDGRSEISNFYHVLKTDAWGDYAPAIARWERILGREAPSPTEPAPKGGRRLSPRFTEWMMGMPEGWVTDVPGVSRNAALRLCGNGVVSLQAEAALREMLSWEVAA